MVTKLIDKLFQINPNLNREITGDWNCLPAGDECLIEEDWGLRSIGDSDSIYIRHAISAPTFVPLAQWTSTYVQAFFGIYFSFDLSSALFAFFSVDPWGGVLLSEDVERSLFAFVSAAEYGAGIEDDRDKDLSIRIRNEYWNNCRGDLAALMADRNIDPNAWCFDFPCPGLGWGISSTHEQMRNICGIATSNCTNACRLGDIAKAKEYISLALANRRIIGANTMWSNLLCHNIDTKPVSFASQVKLLEKCDWTFGRIPWSEVDPSWNAPVYLSMQFLLSGDDPDSLRTRSLECLGHGQLQHAWGLATLMMRAVKTSTNDLSFQYEDALNVMNDCISKGSGAPLLILES